MWLIEHVLHKMLSYINSTLATKKLPKSCAKSQNNNLLNLASKSKFDSTHPNYFQGRETNPWIISQKLPEICEKTNINVDLIKAISSLYKQPVMKMKSNHARLNNIKRIETGTSLTLFEIHVPKKNVKELKTKISFWKWKLDIYVNLSCMKGHQHTFLEVTIFITKKQTATFCFLYKINRFSNWIVNKKEIFLPFLFSCVVLI